MQSRTIVTLEKAAKDLDTGKAFYDAKEEGRIQKRLFSVVSFSRNQHNPRISTNPKVKPSLAE